jgi:hypothetical protein
MNVSRTSFQKTSSNHDLPVPEVQEFIHCRKRLGITSRALELGQGSG